VAKVGTSNQDRKKKSLKEVRSFIIFVLYLGKISEQQLFASACVIGVGVATIVERRIWARCDGRYESNVA